MMYARVEMRTPRRLRLGLALLLPVVLAGAFSCRGPTEIVVHLRTDLPCADSAEWHGVAVTTAAPGIDVETRAPVLTSAACDANGNIGSLVLVPSGPKDGLTSVRVVAGVRRAPEDCAANAYAGCIVERRTFNFLPHESLDIEINLTRACVGEACDALSTCVAGVCLDSRVNPPPAPTLTAPDATVDGQASLDAAAGARVRCGDNGIECPLTGTVCCLAVGDGGTHGECVNSTKCPSAGIVLRCDDESDCPGRDDAGRPNLCCLSYKGGPGGLQDPTEISGAACLSYAECIPNDYKGLELCQHRDGCLDHTKACEAANRFLPGYFWCPVP